MLKVIITSTTNRVRIKSIGPRGIQGEVGQAGEQGEAGAAGQGVPVGGSVGQYLAKDSSTDFDTSWQDFPDTAWGDLTGDITDQLDLIALLDAKQDVITPGTTLQFYRGDKTFQTLNTAIVPESGNLYYTQSRFDTAFAAKDTDDLAEGARLYYTQDRFDTAFGLKTTANLSELTNLYFTDERAQDAVGTILTDTSSVDFSYNDALNTISAVVLPAGVDHNSLANLTTGDVHTQYVLLAASISGRRYCIKKIDVSANAITVATTSSQTIDGSTTYSLPTQWKYVTVQSNGANWIVVANN